jgi:3-isopropylmalate/(R)-2-methylmalate dehydratase small subunit
MRSISVIEGGVTVLDRSNVDTDQIIPKQFLKRVERSGFGEFLFYDWAKEPGWELPKNPILATGRNFGSGSSREHAPWALEDYGFEAIVAPSFADIFYSNCTKIGLLPVVLDEAEVRAVMDAGSARIDLAAQEVRWDGGQASFEIDPEIRRRLLEGLDDIGVTLQLADAIDRYEAERERSGPVTTTGMASLRGGHRPPLAPRR